MFGNVTRQVISLKPYVIESYEQAHLCWDGTIKLTVVDAELSQKDHIPNLSTDGASNIGVEHLKFGQFCKLVNLFGDSSTQSSAVVNSKGSKRFDIPNLGGDRSTKGKATDP